MTPVTLIARVRDLHRWEWGWLALLALIFLIRFPVKFSLDPPYLMDFEVYRAVAQRIAHGQARHLYDPTTSELMPFKYAPCWAVVFLPLAWLPAHPGAVLWATLTVVWLLLACWGSARLCQHATLRAPPWLAVCAVLLLVRPITAEFLNGQVDLLWGCLVIGFLVADGTTRPWWAALSLALAIALKLPAFIVLVYLLLRGRVGMAARVVSMFLVANLAASLLLDPHQPLVLFHAWGRVLWTSGVSRAFEIGNQSLLALAGRFLSADGYRLNVSNLSPPAVLLVALLAASALFGLVVVGPRIRTLSDQARRLFDGSLLTILMVLCSPTTWLATYSTLVLPVSVAVACAFTRPRATWRHGPATIVAAALVILSTMTHSRFWKSLGIMSLRGESYVFLVLMVLPWFGLALFAYLWLQRQSLISANGYAD